MVSDDRNYERIHAALLHGLSLSAADLASSAVQLHAVVAGVLSLEAGQTVHRATKTATGDSNPDNIAGKTRLAALAVFHKLSSLQNGIPITLVSLYDFIIVFTSSDSHASANEVSLARRTIASLLRKKPSLVRALENQLLPAWSDTMTSFRPTVQDHWLDEARALFTSISVVSRIATVRDALQASSSSSPFWSAYQTFYDIVLPKLFSSSIHADAQPLSQLSSVKDYAAFRKDLVDYFTSFFPQLSAETLTESLENEASNPELPENLTDLPLTSLINMTLLQDAEYYYGISRQVGLRKPAITSMSQEERSYLQNALDFSKTLPKDNISDSLAIVSKGKGKASTNGHEGQSSASKITAMMAEVLNILPDTPVQDIRRLLSSAALEQVADDQKVERVISILLEGEPSGPNDSILPAEELSRLTPDESKQWANAPKTSAFASARSNIFNDALDVSRLHRGKQDFKNDTFLPSELRASILAAAERQAQESDEEDDEAADDAFAEVDEDAETLAKIKVKDDVSEESGLEDEESGNRAAQPSRTATPSGVRQGGTSATSSLGATGVPKELESLYITTYTKEASTFTREARKSPARAELKKKIAALRLPQTIADEQIEGWARMLERNSKKDKILERFNDKQFQGNEKGMDVRASSSQGNANQDGPKETGQSSRGGHGERGRGRGRGRGGARQSDQRRRGHDRKMQKAGL